MSFTYVFYQFYYFICYIVYFLLLILYSLGFGNSREEVSSINQLSRLQNVAAVHTDTAGWRHQLRSTWRNSCWSAGCQVERRQYDIWKWRISFAKSGPGYAEMCLQMQFRYDWQQARKFVSLHILLILHVRISWYLYLIHHRCPF